MHEQVRVIEFASDEDRETYLRRYYEQRGWLEDRAAATRRRR